MSAGNGAETADAADENDRRRRLVALLGDGEDDTSSRHGLPGIPRRLERLCVITVDEVAVDGAGVTVMGSVNGGLAGHRDQLAATGSLTRALEDLQLTAGEGPCLDAYMSGAPVLAGDIAGETTRWLGFGPEALAAGARALFSLPLQVGAVRLGTLDLNRARAGPLSREQLADALALAVLATEVLLELAETSEPGRESPSPEVEQWSEAGWLPDVHADVHVASGMVSARAGIDVGTALLRIRAHAFARSEPIHDVAQRIIDRDLILDGPGLPTDPRDDGPSAPDPENG